MGGALRARGLHRAARALAAALVATACATAAGEAVATATGLAPPGPSRAGRVFLPVALDGWTLRELPPVRFATPHGLFDAPFDLVLAPPVAGAMVRYTLDGTAPGPNAGATYDGPLRIAATTIVRAIALHAAYRPSPIATATYLFPAAVIAQPDLPPGFPPIWGTYTEGPFTGRPVPADYAMDPKVTGDPRYAATMVDDLRSIPTLSIVADPADLFGLSPEHPGIYTHPLARGEQTVDPLSGAVNRPWERPVSAEWLPPDGGPGFQIDAGLRIAGGWSRKPDGTAKHSFSLRFRSEYGAGRLRYPLFDGPGPSAFNALRLRGGQADSFHYFGAQAQYVHDQWGRATQLAMGGPAARGTWAHLYLDGLYWGIYNVTEELEAAFMANHMGGVPADWDVIEAVGEIETPGGDWRVEDGEATAFNDLITLRDTSLAAGGAIDRATYTLASALLDIPQYVDYTLIQMYGDNWDWPHKNWTAARSRVHGGGFRFFVWDIEHMVQLREREGVCGPCNDRPAVATCGLRRCGTSVATPGAAGLHGWLMGSPEYRLAFADAARRRLLDDGALAPGPAAARFGELAARVERAIVGESARWGDVAFGERTKNENWHFLGPFSFRGRVFTLDDHWRPQHDRLLAGFFPTRSAAVLQQLCDAGLYPSVAALTMAAGVGDAADGARLAIAPRDGGCFGTTAVGTVYYTLDGTDPRVAFSGDVATPWSGAPSPTALVYRGPFRLPSRYLRVRARLRTPDGRWGPATESAFGAPRVALTEIMYHPADDEALEFVELVHRERSPVDLSGARLSNAVTATLPAGTVLRPGEHIVVAADPAAFAARYRGVTPVAAFAGHLANGGERIDLAAADGAPLLSVRYDDEGFWPLAADGTGFSLVPRDPDGLADPRAPESWRASARAGGSPGAADPPSPRADEVVLNEVLARSDAPFEDAVELRNGGSEPADVSGWYLSDDRATPAKYRIPDGTVIPPGGFTAFYERAFRALAPPDRAFALSGDGETVYLMSADAAGRPTGYFHGLSFGAGDPGMSYGRIRHAAGTDAAPLVRPTFGVDDPVDVAAFRAGRGAPNAPPRIGPVVLSELMPRPSDGRPAFIEIHNLGDDPVALGGDVRTGTGQWALVDGVTYLFPPGAALAPGGYAVLGPDEPEALAARLDLPPDAAAYGPWTGRLAPDGERVALARPPLGVAADLVEGPWIPVDAVGYALDAPWRADLARAGASIERVAPIGFGGDPASWLALRTGGTPGRPNSLVAVVRLPLLLR